MFDIGDIITVRYGKAPAIVTWVGTYEVTFQYYRSGHMDTIPTNDAHFYEDQEGPLEDMVCRVKGFEYFNNNVKTQEDNTMTLNALYEVTQGKETQYATKLAVNSAGKWLMEEKGTGNTLVVDKENVQEVMPHTITVKRGTSSKSCSYFADAGVYTVGDFYITDGASGSTQEKTFAIEQITGVDTKAKHASKEFKPIAMLNTSPMLAIPC
jgi:hypothetical protein